MKHQLLSIILIFCISAGTQASSVTFAFSFTDAFSTIEVEGLILGLEANGLGQTATEVLVTTLSSATPMPLVFSGTEAGVVANAFDVQNGNILNGEFNVDYPDLIFSIVYFGPGDLSGGSLIWDDPTGNLISAFDTDVVTIRPVPLPAAAWLFGSALIGASIVGRCKKKET